MDNSHHTTFKRFIVINLPIKSGLRPSSEEEDWATDGTRTRNSQYHKLELYH